MMKSIGYFSLYDVRPVFIGGCGNQNLKQWEKPWDPNSIWDGSIPEGGAIPDFFEGMPPHGGEFPKSMAGIWEAEIPDVLWDIKFEPSGSILRIVHAVVGEVDISQGAVEGNIPDKALITSFIWAPASRDMTPMGGLVRVKIVVDYFIINFPAGTIEGRMEDYFEGFVSEDGNRWDTMWYSFGWLKGARPPNIKEIKAHPMPLVFIKLDPTQPRAEQVME